MRKVRFKRMMRVLAILWLVCCGAMPASAALLIVDQAELDIQRTKWEASGIENYSYTIKHNCFFIPTHTKSHLITVRNNVITDFLFSDTLQPDLESDRSHFGPIDSLFDILQTGLGHKRFVFIDDMGLSGPGPAIVKAAFDPILGHPVQIYIDYSILIADEELYLKITSFSALNSTTAVDVPPSGLLLLSFFGVGGLCRGLSRRRG